MEKKKLLATFFLIIAIILFIASLVVFMYIILSNSTEKRNIAYGAILIFILSGFLIAYAGDFLIRNKKR